MFLSAFFIRRPVATSLLAVAILFAGALAFTLLPVSSLPQVDFPTILVRASLPGASPETMASSVATPLERALGRIAGVTEITSTSTLGSTSVTLQFSLDRDSNGAARDVQAAINAARPMLPTGLPNNPSYRKVNPADAPILILALTSAVLSQGQMYDAASTILAQKLSQIRGIGQVVVGGSSLPAVRVELQPGALNKYGIGLEKVRAALTASNTNRPKGMLESAERHWQIYANDQARTAADYMPLIISYYNGAAVRLSDVSEVLDSVQDLRNAGSVNGKPSVLLALYRESGANIVTTVEQVRSSLPSLAAAIPQSIQLNVAVDRTTTIRASLNEVERSLIISIGLVVLVVFLFLRNVPATLIPTITIPVSLAGTFVVMYLVGFSLNNLSLMALTVAIGFIVDDTVVVLENIMRSIEQGMRPLDAAIKGIRDVGFTVLSMSLSLIAVFTPIVMMGGIVGRLLREFAVSLCAAVLVSLLVSLTLTPMLCSRWIYVARQSAQSGWFYRRSTRVFDSMLGAYQRSLHWTLGHSRFVMLALLAIIALNIGLYIIVPKGFFPQQDTGRLTGTLRADQSISFQAMSATLQRVINQVRHDPAVDTVVGFTGGGQRNVAKLFISLKPLSKRRDTAAQVIGRLRKQLATEPVAKLFLQPVQDIRIGGRATNAQYQYTLQGDDLEVLRQWAPRIQQAIARLPEVTDVNSDQQPRGLQSTLIFNREVMARLGLTQRQVDAVLNDAFGQRQVSTIYQELNQYKVVMELAPQYWQNPAALKEIYVQTPSRLSVPLAEFSRYQADNTSLVVNHQDQFAATTLSFNLPVNVSLSEASVAINKAIAGLNVPVSVRGSFQGMAKTFQASLKSQPWLILAALAAVYIVLGILYESYVHPLTILSTLPSAGVGALLALLACGDEFSIVALIGVLLLIGMVKKNAIILVDFALTAERQQGLSPLEAIYQACVLRLRPIMMTTMAALLGALPLALGSGDGAEMRRPLGVAIVGGLIVSQGLTLYTTAVVYLYLARLRLWWLRYCKRPTVGVEADDTPA